MTEEMVVNKEVLEMACLSSYKKYSVVIDRTFLRLLLSKIDERRKPEGESGRANFRESLRLSLNELRLNGKARTVYRHAACSYFGRIAGLAKRARKARGVPTPVRKEVVTPIYTKADRKGQLAFNI